SQQDHLEPERSEIAEQETGGVGRRDLCSGLGSAHGCASLREHAIVGWQGRNSSERSSYGPSSRAATPMTVSATVTRCPGIPVTASFTKKGCSRNRSRRWTCPAARWHSSGDVAGVLWPDARWRSSRA